MSWGPDTRFMECQRAVLLLRCCRNRSQNKGRLTARVPGGFVEDEATALTSKVTLGGI